MVFYLAPVKGEVMLGENFMFMSFVLLKNIFVLKDTIQNITWSKDLSTT